MRPSRRTTHDRSDDRRDDLRGGDGAPRGDHQAPRLRRGRPAGDPRPGPRGPRPGRILCRRAGRCGAGTGGAAVGRARGAARGRGRVSTYQELAALSLRIDDYALEGLEMEVSSDFTRRSTVIRLRGAGV